MVGAGVGCDSTGFVSSGVVNSNFGDFALIKRSGVNVS